jgi:hypothetical protein
MLINIINVEEKVFYDKEVWRDMPDLVHLRDQWRVSKMSPMLRGMGKKALSDFLSMAKDKHERALSKRFGSEVTIDRIETRIVNNLEFDAREDFPDIDFKLGYTGFCTHREGEKIFLTFWR